MNPCDRLHILFLSFNARLSSCMSVGIFSLTAFICPILQIPSDNDFLPRLYSIYYRLNQQALSFQHENAEYIKCNVHAFRKYLC